MQVKLIDPNALVIIGVDREPIGDIEGARVDSRAREFGAHDGDEVLVRDIYVRGVQVSVVARKVGKTLELVDGQRRTMAARQANALRIKAGEEPHAIPVTVEAKDELEALQAKVSLNRNRRGDDPIELATMLSVLVTAQQARGKDYMEAVRITGQDGNMSEGSVRNYLKIKSLPPEIQDQIRLGNLGIAAAVALAGVDPEKASAVASKIIERGEGKDASAVRAERDNAAKSGLDKKTMKGISLLFSIESKNGGKYKECESEVRLIQVILGHRPTTDLSPGLQEMLRRVQKGA